jgi:hypothetical protein
MMVVVSLSRERGREREREERRREMRTKKTFFVPAPNLKQNRA